MGQLFEDHGVSIGNAEIVFDEQTNSKTKIKLKERKERKACNQSAARNIFNIPKRQWKLHFILTRV